MDGPKANYTERSKSERERQISSNNTYIWNLDRWYTDDPIYRAAKGDADIKDRLLNTAGEGKGGMI